MHNLYSLNTTRIRTEIQTTCIMLFLSVTLSLDNGGRTIKARVPSYDYNMHVEDLLAANLCLVTLLSSLVAI